MITSTQCLKRYGPPEKENNLALLTVPETVRKQLPALPGRIYANKDIHDPLLKAFSNIIQRKLQKQLITWDGCFNIRKKRGAQSSSLHSWAIAIDINAAYNQFGKKPTMSTALVKCFTDAGFDWGGTWTKPDGMHFQLSKFPG
jgi:hypothetical protein